MFKVKLIGGALGAELSGVDLAKDLSAPVLKEIRNLLIKHEVIFFKDQGSSVIWALTMAYSIFQGSLFRKRWNSNAWQQLSLRS